MYFCFITSALVTIVTYHARLPEGTDKVFQALAFLGEGMLMGLHEKHDPLVRQKMESVHVYFFSVSYVVCLYVSH